MQKSHLLPKAARCALVSHLIFIANRGFLATHKTVLRTAYELLQKLGLSIRISKLQSYRFIKREARLQTKYSRSLDAVRALKNNNRHSIQGQFTLLKQTIEAFEIKLENTYNMDKTSFIISVISTSLKVVIKAINLECKQRRITKASIIQPSNREQVIVI